jgi:hypothetical protein
MTADNIVELAQPTAEKPKAPLRLKRKRSPWTPRPKPLDRSALDGRTHAAKAFDTLKRQIVGELGNDISTIEDGIVDGYIGALVGVRGDLTRLFQGGAIDWSEYCGKLSTMVRAASRLQPWRRQRDVTPSLASYLASAKEEVDA